MTGAQFLVGHFLTIMAYEIWEGATVLCVMYFIANDYDTERAYAAGIDMSLMASGLLLFHLNHALFIILLTWVFPKGWAGLIVGFLVTVAGPDFAGTGPIFLSVANYMTTDRKYKLLSCLLPNTGLVAFLRIIFMARDFEGKADWKVVNQRLLERDNVAISEIWAGMVVTDAAMIVLAWYLSKVLPWSTDNPQGLLFFLMPSYWWSRVDEVPEAAMAQRSSARFEKPPPGVRRIINVQNLTKMFGSKPALNGLDLAVYESKVTVLLGHNGAGKTTLMSILTGIKGPTSGTACVCGFNAAVQRDAIRKVVSLCQQFDIFFGDMTCAENLLYFGSLKGSDMKGLHEAIVDTLKIVNLEEKMHCMPAELSGGMKRRLSMAIAIVSNPKVVILDEPTAGMDPETRRNVWDVIQTVGKKHTVLLSSHDMEEADALGDFIVVMAQGRAVCAGTTAFLKKACGTRH
ncbi:phospholipid-transporting ATPase ABCA3-like [Haemaphysalis longicornis]